MNTRKLTMIFVILLIFYFILQFSIIYFSHGHHVTYIIKNNKNQITIDEIYTKKIKGEKDNYYLTFKVSNNIFNLQLFSNFNKNNYIVKDVKYYEDNKYKCIYPIFKDKKQYTDIICYTGSKYINYTNIIGDDKNLDTFVNNIKEYKKSDKSSIVNSNNMKIYKDNLVSDHKLAIETYKGLYLVNSNKLIQLFNNDVYTKDIHAFIDRYYITADYSKNYNFNNIYLIDIVDGKKYQIKYNKNISFDGYIMGSIDNEVYLLDKNNQKQYLIDIKKKDIHLNSDNDMITILINNEKQKVSIYKALKQKITFNKYQSDFDSNYERVDKVGGKLSGYYYLYKKVGNSYDIYRSNVQDKDKLTLITNVSDIDSIVYIDDYIYFKDDDKIKYYHDSVGIKDVVKNNELKYNKSLIYGVFK